MKWCCLTFKSWYESAGERGLSILVDCNSNGEPEFILQHRAIDRTVESLPVTDYPLSLVSDVCIGYCPWCGRNLKKWYVKNVAHLVRPGYKINWDTH